MWRCQDASCHSSAGAAGDAAVRGRGEPGAQRAPSQLGSRWVLGGAQECTRRPRLGCRHLAAAAGPGPPPAWHWSSPLLAPPAAPSWVWLCPAGPEGGGQPPPGGHSLVGPVDTLPGTRQPGEARKVTSNLVLKDEQGLVGPEGARTKAVARRRVGRRPRCGRAGQSRPAPRPELWPGPAGSQAAMGCHGHAIAGASVSPHGTEGAGPCRVLSSAPGCRGATPSRLLLGPKAGGRTGQDGAQGPGSEQLSHGSGGPVGRSQKVLSREECGVEVIRGCEVRWGSAAIFGVTGWGPKQQTHGAEGRGWRGRCQAGDHSA